MPAFPPIATMYPSPQAVDREPADQAERALVSLIIDWAPLFALPSAVLALTPAWWPRWGLMWLLAVALYAACKWLTWRSASPSAAPWWKHLAYLTLWPGLDAPAFLTCRPPAEWRPTAAEWLFAAGKLLLGVALFWGARRVAPALPPLVLGWLGMAGIVFMLHFGLFHLMSCGWRSAGLDARPLMNWPVASRSLGEFWALRWNIAFRDATHRLLFRPLTTRLGGRRALVIGFVVSGLIHDLVISVPAGLGYGLPTLYFIVQGCAMFFERSPLGRRVGLGSGWRGWLYTGFIVLLPAGLLFHPPFVLRVIVPFMHALGGLPAAS
jgi:hypothetical protein